MTLTGEEIRARLTAFAAHWSLYDGSERPEAQTFINELLERYGSRRRSVGGEFHQERGFVDFRWPRVCLFEMKAPSEAKRLGRHRPQARAYTPTSCFETCPWPIRRRASAGASPTRRRVLSPSVRPSRSRTASA